MSARSVFCRTLAIVLGFSAGASADVRLTVRTTDGESEIRGKVHPATESESIVFIGKDRVRKSSSLLDLIVRFDKGLFYMLDNSGKVYYSLKMPFVLRDHLPSEVAELFKNADALKPKLTIVDTGETRKIGRWTTRHCIATLTTQGAVHQEAHIWATRDLGIDHALYARAMAVVGGLAPIQLPIEELEKACEGFPVLRETKGEFFGAPVSLREELISAETVELPASFYDPPAGFREEEADFLDLIQRTPYDLDL